MTQSNTDILLVAVNARYSHCAFAARSLIANLGALAPRASLLECDLEITPLQLAQRILAYSPRVVSFTTYLWNVRLVEATARIPQGIARRVCSRRSELTADYPHTDLSTP